MNNKYLIGSNVIMLAAIVVLAILFQQSCEKNKRDQDLWESQITWLHDSIETRLDRNGRETATVAALVAGNKKDAKKVLDGIENLTEEQERIRTIIKEEKDAIAAVAATMETILFGTSPTTEISMGEDSLWPIYKTMLSEEWISGQIIASKENFEYELEVVNRFDITHKRDRKWFKPDVYTVDIKNLNPYTRTVGASSYTLQPPRKKFNLGFQVGYGITGTQLSPYMGVGINYSLITLF